MFTKAAIIGLTESIITLCSVSGHLTHFKTIKILTANLRNLCRNSKNNSHYDGEWYLKC
jgi:hypothetical protein